MVWAGPGSLGGAGACAPAHRRMSYDPTEPVVHTTGCASQAASRTVKPLEERFGLGYQGLCADEQRRALVQRRGHDVQDGLPPVAGGTPRLLDQEGHRRGLVQETQLAVGELRVLGVARIVEDAALQQRAVD